MKDYDEAIEFNTEKFNFNLFGRNLSRRTSRIKKMKSEGLSIRAIALYLSKSTSTISREIKRKRGRNGIYHPVTPQRLYFERKENCSRNISITSVVLEYFNYKIDDSWSPEHIYFRSMIENSKLDIPSFSTIYRWIHLGIIAKGDMKKLRHKGEFKRSQETRDRFNIGKVINNRPKIVYKR